MFIIHTFKKYWLLILLIIAVIDFYFIITDRLRLVMSDILGVSFIILWLITVFIGLYAAFKELAKSEDALNKLEREMYYIYHNEANKQPE